jgi:hypothetical protein
LQDEQLILCCGQVKVSHVQRDVVAGWGIDVPDTVIRDRADVLSPERIREGEARRVDDAASAQDIIATVFHKWLAGVGRNNRTAVCGVWHTLT